MRVSPEDGRSSGSSFRLVALNSAIRWLWFVLAIPASISNRNGASNSNKIFFQQCKQAISRIAQVRDRALYLTRKVIFCEVVSRWVPRRCWSYCGRCMLRTQSPSTLCSYNEPRHYGIREFTAVSRYLKWNSLMHIGLFWFACTFYKETMQLSTVNKTFIVITLPSYCSFYIIILLYHYIILYYY